MSSKYLNVEQKILLELLIKKQMDNCKLIEKEFSIEDEALKLIIQLYTREAGVRSLERHLSKLTRKVVTLIEKKQINYKIKIYYII